MLKRVFALAVFISFFNNSLLHASTYTHEISIQIIHFTNNLWTKSEIQKHFNDAQRILKQCDVKMNVVSYIESTTKYEDIYYDLEGYTDEEDLVDEHGTLTYAKRFASSNPNVIKVFFFERFDPQYARLIATSMPATRVKYEDQKPVLNSIWMSYLSEKYKNAPIEEGGFREGYDTLAHELGHVLLNQQHLEDYWEENLMSENPWAINRHLKLTQCQKIKRSPLAYRVKAY